MLTAYYLVPWRVQFNLEKQQQKKSNEKRLMLELINLY